MLPQLIYGDTCQIRVKFKVSSSYLYKIIHICNAFCWIHHFKLIHTQCDFVWILTVTTPKYLICTPHVTIRAELRLTNVCELFQVNAHARGTSATGWLCFMRCMPRILTRLFQMCIQHKYLKHFWLTFCKIATQGIWKFAIFWKGRGTFEYTWYSLS